MRIASLATAVVLAFSANVYASYMDSIRARCEAYGSTPGTRDFYQCLHDVTVQEARNREQKTLEPVVSRCSSSSQVVAESVLGEQTTFSSLDVVAHLSQVSLSGCSPQLQ